MLISSRSTVLDHQRREDHRRDRAGLLLPAQVAEGNGQVLPVIFQANPPVVGGDPREEGQKGIAQGDEPGNRVETVAGDGQHPLRGLVGTRRRGAAGHADHVLAVDQVIAGPEHAARGPRDQPDVMAETRDLLLEPVQDDRHPEPRSQRTAANGNDHQFRLRLARDRPRPVAERVLVANQLQAAQSAPDSEVLGDRVDPRAERQEAQRSLRVVSVHLGKTELVRVVVDQGEPECPDQEDERRRPRERSGEM